MYTVCKQYYKKNILRLCYIMTINSNGKRKLYFYNAEYTFKIVFFILILLNSTYMQITDYKKFYELYYNNNYINMLYRLLIDFIYCSWVRFFSTYLVAKKAKRVCIKFD